ncbi:SCO2322 family protein [Streptomyces durmitorensis]|uniref:SCO2322 family protein n=1 Tax=Streptomyces durmitorensis TaxID=319947 RepID=A0ABY4Q0U5_9ACTN|nr:SCO2322 family protein [Streptomyces durmitorensis]UQT58812.1 SCO2322 family protein [Streptomyces durmitorensis]
MTRGRARCGRLVIGALLAALFGVLAAAPAQAAGYRYWSFWDRDGAKWAYASQGPSTAHPDDGAVQGFRFSVSEDSKDAAKPRGAADFDAICAKTPAKDDRKRIALVVDFGTPGDAPDGESPPKPRTACAQVADDATSADALAAVAKPLRYDSNALLCAIADYPKSGCGEQVAGNGQSEKAEKKPTAGESSESGEEKGDSGGPSVGLIAGVAAIALLGGAAVWQARRRRG